MQDPQQSKPSKSDSLNFFMLLANGHAMCLTPFLHWGFGVRYPGGVGLAAMVMIFAGMGLTGDPIFVPYFWVWLLALAIQRCYALKLRRQGVMLHSFYDGYPWLVTKLLGFKSEATARVGEAICCLVAGGTLAALGMEGLGKFLMLGCLSLSAVEAMKRQVRYQQVLSAQDAMIEMQAYQERIEGRGQDF